MSKEVAHMAQMYSSVGLGVSKWTYALRSGVCNLWKAENSIKKYDIRQKISIEYLSVHNLIPYNVCLYRVLPFSSLCSTNLPTYMMNHVDTINSTLFNTILHYCNFIQQQNVEEDIYKSHTRDREFYGM